MTPTLTAAAERLISLPGFRWMPGMCDTKGRRFIAYEELMVSIQPEEISEYWGPDELGTYSPAIPDLTDPATLGCVWQMVCDAWGDPGFTLYGERLYDGSTDSHYFKFMAEPSSPARPESLRVWLDTRGECLVNALAAAAGAR